MNKIPDLNNYTVKNVRDYCKVNTSREKCNINLHCLWASNDCKLQLKYDHLLEFINKIIEEMILNNIQFKELIQESNYFVSDIVNYNLYTVREIKELSKQVTLILKKLWENYLEKINYQQWVERKCQKR